jgi:hypothetical protein
VYALEDKVNAMLKYKRPTSLRELRGFLGLMSYYRKFIKDFSHIAAPLTELTKQTRGNKSSRHKDGITSSLGKWCLDFGSRRSLRNLEGCATLSANISLTQPHPQMEVSNRCFRCCYGSCSQSDQRQGRRTSRCLPLS